MTAPPPPRPPDALVEATDLVKVYEPSPRLLRMVLRSAITEPVVALDGVSFTVAPGEAVAVVGPNGAGKTTLFRMLTGLTTPTRGSAHIAGFDVVGDSLQARRVTGFMPGDDRSLLLRLTCRANLEFHGHLRGMSAGRLSSRIDAVLELVGLAPVAHRAGFALSSGMKARLQLARAILHEPAVVILDEPTGTIDPVGAAELLAVIRRTVREEGRAALISSHRLEEIESLSDHVIVLHGGKLVHDGPLRNASRLIRVDAVELRFKTDAAARQASEALRGVGFELTLEGPVVTVATELAPGTLLGHLGPCLSDLVEAKHVVPDLVTVLSALIDRPRI